MTSFVCQEVGCFIVHLFNFILLFTNLQSYSIFSVSNSSCGKVMFSQACVKNSVQAGGGDPCRETPPWADHPWLDTPWSTDTPLGRHLLPRAANTPGIHPSGQTSTWAKTPHSPDQTHPGQTPHPRDGHCSGRYASYWNDFLFQMKFKNTVLQS